MQIRPNKVPLGRVVVTPNSEALIDREEIRRALARHASGDYGDYGRELDEEQWDINEENLKDGKHFVDSLYVDRNNVDYCVVTDLEQSTTTVFVPDEEEL